MPVFDYIALDPDGNRRSGTIDAPGEELAMNKLREEGLTPLACKPLKEPTNIEDILARFRDVPQVTLVYFSRQLATMIGSGMSPLRSLAVMEEQEENPKFKDILGDIIGRIESGEEMSEAFAHHETVFPRLFTSMLRAGEESGNLAGSLTELAMQLEKALRLRRAVKAASYYPLIMGAIAFIVISIMLIFIVPTFAKLFVTTVHQTETPNPKTGKYPHSAALPAPTQFVVAMSHILYPASDAWRTAGFWIGTLHPFSPGALVRLILLAGFGFAASRVIRRILREDGPREKWDGFKLHCPMKIGPLIQKLAVARFSRTFASLLRAGVPTQDALEIVAETAGNRLVSNAVLEARDRMLAGANISEPLARSGVFPGMVTRMIEVGEETGQLEHMLLKVAEFFEEEVEMQIKALVSIIEPLMILLVGVAIGFIIIATYLPMFQLYNLVGTG